MIGIIIRHHDASTEKDTEGVFEGKSIKLLHHLLDGGSRWMGEFWACEGKWDGAGWGGQEEP